MLELLGWNSTVMWNQALLFKKSSELGYNSEEFVKCFMTSELGKEYYTFGTPNQWIGYGYNLEKMEQRYIERITKDGEVYHPEIMHWVGWIYYFWHIETEESPKDIYRQARCSDVVKLYAGYHGCSESYVIQELKRMHQENNNVRDSHELDAQ